MKRMKKIVSILLTAAMVLGMSITAFATSADPITTPSNEAKFTITLTGVESKNHTFAAYQIFKGDLAQTKEEVSGEAEQGGILSNIEWGSSINQAKIADLIAALRVIELEDKSTPFSGLPESPKASDVAKVLENVSGKDAELAIKFADVVGSTDANDNLNYLSTAAGTSSGEGTPEAGTGKYSYTISDLMPGYYLVQDTSDSMPKTESYTRNIMEVVSNVTAKIKADTIKIEKKIVEGNNKVDANTAGVGKVVSYEITGIVPNTTGYDKYFYVINDKLSDGLTYNDGSLTVKYVKAENVGKENEADFALNLAAGEWYLYTGDKASVENENGEIVEYTFRVALKDLVTSSTLEKGDKVIVNYSATVNSSAVTTVEGNPNKVTLTYSNNPNHDYKNDESTDNPGLPDSTKDVPTGVTPEDITITYVAEIDITKTFSDLGATDLLPGATFTLTGTSYQTVLEGRDYFEINAKAATKYYLLKNGTYTTTAPQMNDTMVEASPSASAGYVLAEENYTGKNAVVAYLNGESKVFRPYDKAKDNTATVYVLKENNAGDYVDPAVVYEKKSETVTREVETPVTMVGVTDENGKLTFKGLGKGIYTISETGVPVGYNKADDVIVEINCTVPSVVPVPTGDGPQWTIGTKSNNSVGFEAANVVERDDGSIYSTVGVYTTGIENNKGALLPSTGGIGTTIFYVGGSILVLAAVVLLVTKKRMSREK